MAADGIRMLGRRRAVARLPAACAAQLGRLRRLAALARDGFLASDIGLVRLRSACQAVLTMITAMAAEYAFVRLTGVLQLPVPAAAPAAQAARIGFFDHATLMVSLILGIMMGMMSGFAGPMALSVRDVLVTFGWLPVPLVAALALGLWVGGERTLTLAVLVLVFAAGTYARRFGKLGFLGGVQGFIGFFLGFFLREHAAITLAALAPLAAEVVLAALAAIAVQLVVFFPGAAARARRCLRSYLARSRRAARAVLRVLDAPDARRGGRLPRAGREAGHRARNRAARRADRLVDLAAEAALVTDVQAAAVTRPGPGAPSPDLLRRSLFAHESALAGLACAVKDRAGLACTGSPSETADGGGIRACLEVLAGGEAAGPAAGCRRTAAGRAGSCAPVPAGPAAGDIAALTEVLHRCAARRPAGPAAATPTPGPPRPGAVAPAALALRARPPEEPVVLFGTWLPGATLVSRSASTQADPRPGRRSLRLSPHVRSALQMAVAGVAAIVAGSILSGYRFYWAALAAFFILVGTNNTGEQMRKALYRVAGTLVGVGVSVPIVRAAGHSPAAVIAVVLGSLFFGMYLIRVNYTLMLIGITVAVAELYVEFHEFSDGLLLLRFDETAVGAGVTALAVLLILPLRQTRVVHAAARHYAQALAELALPGRLTLAGLRRADAAYQALLAAGGPRHTPYGPLRGAPVRSVRRLLAAARDGYRRSRGTVDPEALRQAALRLEHLTAAESRSRHRRDARRGRLPGR